MIRFVGVVDLSAITSGVCWDAPLQQDTGNIQGAALLEVVLALQVLLYKHTYQCLSFLLFNIKQFKKKLLSNFHLGCSNKEQRQSGVLLIG